MTARPSDDGSLPEPARPPALPRAIVVLVGAAAAIVVAAGLQATAWLIGPGFLALVIVIVISPVERRLRGLGLPGWLSTLVLVVLVQGVVLVLAGVILLSVARLAAILPLYVEEADALVRAGTGTLGAFGLGPEQLRALASALDLGKVVGLLTVLLAGVVGLATNLVFLLSLMLFLGIEASGAGDRIAAIGRDRPDVARALGRFAWGTRRYLVVTTVFGLGLAVLDTVAVAALGIPLAVLWGLLAFVTNYIPYVGFWLGVLPPALLALLVGGWRLAAVVLVIYLVLNFATTSLVQPHFVGDAVGLSVTVTFVALVFWAWILGPIGAVLAVPLTLLAKALLVDTDPRAGWADALLGSASEVRRRNVSAAPASGVASAPAQPRTLTANSTTAARVSRTASTTCQLRSSPSTSVTTTATVTAVRTRPTRNDTRRPRAAASTPRKSPPNTATLVKKASGGAVSSTTIVNTSRGVLTAAHTRRNRGRRTASRGAADVDPARCASGASGTGWARCSR
jgi:AI-2 transport protein TqsA